MKFYRKDFYKAKDWITIIPTVEIHIDNMMYVKHNVAITINWLVFHVRFMWMESEDKE
jgi:hypothetical protein